MTEFISGLVGAVIGGVLAMAGSALQSWFQARQSERQFKRQRQLAEENHQRRQAVIENERLRDRMEAQLTYGRKVTIAAARFKSQTRDDMDQAQRTAALMDAIKFVALDFDAPPPFPDFLTDIDMEDDELRELVRKHRRIISEVDAVVSFIDARPSDLPNYVELLGEVDDLARQIGSRCRALQREGRPI